MKKLVIILFLWFSFGNQAKAQLDSITFINLPCYGAVGVTGYASTVPDTNAIGYTWSIDTSLNSYSVWFNGSPGPVQTAAPSVNISFNLASQMYIICVTSFSACCTSNTFCDTVFGQVPPPVFSVNNSSVGIPGDSGLYAVDSLLECPVYYYTWTLIGDATFNNGNQIIYTNGNVTNVNFGFGFTTAYLCVAGITSFGMMSDTVCMVINAPVGINENNDFINSFFYHPQSGHVEIQFNDSYKYNAAIKLHDITGRQIPFTQTISEKNKIIIVPAATLTNGIYFIDIAGHSIRKTLKFIKTE